MLWYRSVSEKFLYWDLDKIVMSRDSKWTDDYMRWKVCIMLASSQALCHPEDYSPQVETLALQKSHKASGQRTGLWAGAGEDNNWQAIVTCNTNPKFPKGKSQFGLFGFKLRLLFYEHELIPNSENTGLSLSTASLVYGNWLDYYAGDGQYASSYGQGGGTGLRDENHYQVELTPGWRWY